jgi:hypothetical protein
MQAIPINWNTCDSHRTVFARHRRRDMIRTLVQRIDIGPEVIRIVFHVTLTVACPSIELCNHHRTQPKWGIGS